MSYRNTNSCFQSPFSVYNYANNEAESLATSQQQPAPVAQGGAATPPSCFNGGCGGGLFGGNNNTAGMTSKQNHKDNKEEANVVTKALFEISPQERDHVTHDIHGVAEVHHEEPDFVQSCLNLLDLELQHPRYQSPMLSKTSEAFRMAMQQNADYVRGMYIKFLRREQFHIRNAADVLIRYFDLKRDLFGSHTLGRDISLSEDYNELDLKCLKAGFLQLLPQRDSAGRPILFKTWYKTEYNVPENCWRNLWYHFNAASEDEESQKKGMVVILYNINPNLIDKFDPVFLMGVGRLIQSTPVRVVSHHFCFYHPSFGGIVNFVNLGFRKSDRVRTRLHHGTHVEAQYELMSYGIPSSIIPVNSDGVMSAKRHVQWLQSREKYEKMFSNQSNNTTNESTPTSFDRNKIICIPSLSDVLFGRGKVFQMHGGNMRLGQILEERGSEYFNAKRNEKSVIARSVVEHMKQEGARFLRQDGDGGLWVEVDDAVAADKVGHGFRNRKQVTNTNATLLKTSSQTIEDGRISKEKRRNDASSLSSFSDDSNSNKKTMREEIPQETTPTNTTVGYNYPLGQKRFRF